MGDLLPPEAATQRALAMRVLETFGRSGYELVTPPLFEHAEVVERGNEIELRDLLRFVEPDSGEVAVLRPDITPQVARIVATRMTQLPAPHRLCYEGRVLRRRRGRARNHRQVLQAGVECVGLPGPAADTEVIGLAASACEAVGLSDFKIELSHGSIAQSLLDQLPAEVRETLTDCLARKDVTALQDACRFASVPKRLEQRMVSAVEHYGGLEVLRAARRSLRWEEARVALQELESICSRLADAGLGPKLAVDLGEIRGSAYYTGVRFDVLGAGPGEPIGTGGRYDNLLGRFGHPAPATGFSLSLENLQWTLRESGSPFRTDTPLRLVVAGRDSARVEAAASQIRESGRTAATLPHAAKRPCLAFAQAWGYDAVLMIGSGPLSAVRCNDGAKRSLRSLEANTLATLDDWARSAGD